MATVPVRYIVDDVEAAIAFYAEHLGFRVELHPAPAFAILSRGDLRLMLSAPTGPGGAAQAMPDGRMPEPGGEWNRIQLEVPDLAVAVDALRAAGARFRNEIVVGRGGSQILVEDPAGNPVELFEPVAREDDTAPADPVASQDSAALARRVLAEIYQGGDLARADELVHPDYVDREPGHPGGAVGPDSVKQTARRLLDAFADLRFEVEDEIAEGDKVVQRVTMSGRHAGALMGAEPTGREFAVPALIYLADCRRQGRRALGEPRRPRPSPSDRAPSGLSPAQHTTPVEN